MEADAALDFFSVRGFDGQGGKNSIITYFLLQIKNFF